MRGRIDGRDQLDSLLSCVLTQDAYSSDSTKTDGRDPSLQPTLPALRMILAGNTPVERASTELAELLGFERLDLVEQVIERRQEAVQKVHLLLILILCC